MRNAPRFGRRRLLHSIKIWKTESTLQSLGEFVDPSATIQSQFFASLNHASSKAINPRSRAEEGRQTTRTRDADYPTRGKAFAYARDKNRGDQVAQVVRKTFSRHATGCVLHSSCAALLQAGDNQSRKAEGSRFSTHTPFPNHWMGTGLNSPWAPAACGRRWHSSHHVVPTVLCSAS